MDQRSVRQTNREAKLSMGTAIGIAAVGLFLFGFGLLQSSQKREEPTDDLDRALKDLQAKITRAETELATVKEGCHLPAGELHALQSDNKHRSEHVADRTKLVKDLEEKNRQNIAAARDGIDDAKRKEQQEFEIARAAVDNEIIKKNQALKFQELLKEVQQAIVTVVSSKGVVGTGFLLEGPPFPVIVTSSELAAKDVDLIIKIQYIPAVSETPRVAVCKAKLHYADKETGIAFLTFEHPGRISLICLERRSIRAALSGERVYAITTQVVGEQLMEFNAFDGTVSSTDRRNGNRNFLQVALPANAGCLGAPLFSSTFALLGIMLGSVEGLEKTALAIPSQDLLTAIGRMPTTR